MEWWSNKQQRLSLSETFAENIRSNKHANKSMAVIQSLHAAASSHKCTLESMKLNCTCPKSQGFGVSVGAIPQKRHWHIFFSSGHFYHRHSWKLAIYFVIWWFTHVCFHSYLKWLQGNIKNHAVGDNKNVRGWRCVLGQGVSPFFSVVPQDGNAEQSKKKTLIATNKLPTMAEVVGIDSRVSAE